MGMTHTALLPGWLRTVWIIASCAVTVVHLRHVWVMNGQRRYWHLGHVLMAVGMVYMYLPHSAHLIPKESGTVLYAAAAIGAVLAAALFRLRDGILNPLWIVVAVEMAVMVYMFLPMHTRSPMLSYLLAVYLAGVGTAWALGKWDRHYLSDRRPGVSHTAPLPVRETGPALRVSLATMSGAMTYMLLAM
jgi:hypothetical protein